MGQHMLRHCIRTLPRAACYAVAILALSACAGERVGCRHNGNTTLPTERFTNSIGVQLQLIHPGTFTAGAGVAPFPLRKAKVSRPFYIGVHEITNHQYEQFERRHTAHLKEIGTDSRYLGAEYPAVFVSWNDADAFCEWLSLLEGHRYRLPTADEWQYCAQAGRDCRYPWGDNWPPSPRTGNLRYTVLDHAGLDLDGFDFTSPVGSFPPNPWQLFDMEGNVTEYCRNAAILPGLLSRPYRVPLEHCAWNYMSGRICMGPSFNPSTQELDSYNTDRFACGFWFVGSDPMKGNRAAGFRIVMECNDTGSVE